MTGLGGMTGWDWVSILLAAVGGCATFDVGRHYLKKAIIKYRARKSANPFTGNGQALTDAEINDALKEWDRMQDEVAHLVVDGWVRIDTYGGRPDPVTYGQLVRYARAGNSGAQAALNAIRQRGYIARGRK